MIADKETKEFVNHILSEDVVSMLEGVRVVVREYPNPNYVAFVQPVGEDGEFCPTGEVTLHINPESVLKPYFEEKNLLVDSLIVHELVHVEQHKSGRLSFTADSTPDNLTVIWEGKLYALPRPPEGELSKEEMDVYTSRPWEDEAFRAQAEFLSANSGIDFETSLFMLKQSA